MFGRNPVAPIDHDKGDILRVVKGSPFQTIQGEGPYQGHSATFIRLHGCNLRCWFCDTEFSNPADPWKSLDELMALVEHYGHQLVVLTGGEPMRQNILPLCTELKRLGFTAQIETAGTVWIDGIDEVADIVISPKTPKVHAALNLHATAFKYVVSADMEIEESTGIPITATQPGTTPRKLATPLNPLTPIYYSVLDEYDPAINARNRTFAAVLAMQHKRRLTLQMHKLCELP